MEELKMNREELRKTSEAMKEQVAQMEKAARLQSLSTLINYNISVAEQFRWTMSQSQTRTKALKKIEIYEAEIKKIAEIKDEIKQ